MATGTIDDQPAIEALRAIGKAIGQIALYDRPDHPYVLALLEEARRKLTYLLGGGKSACVVYSFIGQQVMVNGKPVQGPAELPAALMTFCARREVQSMVFRSGVGLKELGVFCAVAAGRAEDPARALAKAGVTTISLNEAELVVDVPGQDGKRAQRTELRVDQGFVRTNFGRYLAPELVEKLAASPEMLRLGGETRAITVMFVDIRDFTGRAEGMSPEEVTRFINAFLTPMTRVILDHDGFIDKYIGDCIMAFWNAPLEDPDHAKKAACAALAMRKRLAELNIAWRADAEQRGEGFAPVEIGVGINTGECCVGNVGSDQRFEYSALGDAVNLASRLQGRSKDYGVDILIGPETNESLPGFATAELDVIRVKGRAKPTQIFGLLGDARMAKSGAWTRQARLHASFLEAFRAGRWDDAEGFLGAAIGAGSPLKAFCNAYRARISASRRQRPPID